MSSEWYGSSGRRGTPKVPIKRHGENVKCPKCDQEVIVYNGTEIERHKVYAKKPDGSTDKHKWVWCPQRQK